MSKFFKEYEALHEGLNAFHFRHGQGPLYSATHEQIKIYEEFARCLQKGGRN